MPDDPKRWRPVDSATIEMMRKVLREEETPTLQSCPACSGCATCSGLHVVSPEVAAKWREEHR